MKKTIITLFVFFLFRIAFGQSPPVAGFTTADTGCTGSRTVNFQDITTGSPTQWLWFLGDGFSDTLQNPSHTYAADGSYDVSLIACNANGCDTFTKTISLVGPVSDTCTPATSNYCCNSGIYNVSFGTINNTTANGVDGYKDYSCTEFTNVNAGQNYPIEIQTGFSLKENVRVWIDYDGNGSFNSATELVFESLNLMQYHSGIIYIPDTSVVPNVTLRMRIGSDNFTKPAPQPCTNVTYGQFEDYSVKIIPKQIPPTANFLATPVSVCSGQPVQFQDKSLNFPNYWSWDFGDSFTSPLQNPSHTFSDTGVYSVTLIIKNPFGYDTIVKTNYISVAAVPVSSCIPEIVNSCCGTGIYKVQFNTINNYTGDTADGYTDFSCSDFTSVYAGGKYILSIETGPVFNEDLKAWLDYNYDGVFSNSGELLLSSNSLRNHSAEIRIPATNDTNLYLRLRIASDYDGLNHPQACDTLYYGQAEDYGVRILPSHFKPVADFTYTVTNPCERIFSFSDYSEFFPASWQWDFGDGQTGSGETVSHDYLYAGDYTVTLIAGNAYGVDTFTRTVSIDSVFAFFLIDDTLATGQNYYFKNFSAGANSYSWDFGDGFTSTSANPTHNYDFPVIATVILIAQNSVTGCSDTATKQVVVLPGVGLEEIQDAGLKINIFPNPFRVSTTMIIHSEIGNWKLEIFLYDVFGRIVMAFHPDNEYAETLHATSLHTIIQIPRNGLSSGLYYLKIKNSDGNEFYTKLVIE